MAESVIAELDAAKVWDRPIVTEAMPFEAFYKAEDCHQRYYRRNSGLPYYRVVIAPKMAKFHRLYAPRLKSTLAPGDRQPS